MSPCKKNWNLEFLPGIHFGFKSLLLLQILFNHSDFSPEKLGI